MGSLGWLVIRWLYLRNNLVGYGFPRPRGQGPSPPNRSVAASHIFLCSLIGPFRQIATIITIFLQVGGVVQHHLLRFNSLWEMESFHLFGTFFTYTFTRWSRPTKLSVRSHLFSLIFKLEAQT